MPKHKTDKERILKDKEWVDCYICSEVFYRRRETSLYCSECERGFCLGEHGTFLKGKIVSCIHCHPSLNKKKI